MSQSRSLWTAGIAVLTIGGIAAAWLQAPLFPFGLCACVMLSLVSGGSVYALFAREPAILPLISSAAALSPVLVATLGAVAMLAGLPPRLAAGVLILASGAAAVAALRRRGPLLRDPPVTRRQAAAIVVLLGVVIAAISYLPFTRDWWRMRADAWFHAGVVAQIADFGLPPEDPYAAGLPLQYMWLFHVYVLLLSLASHIGPFMIMALANAAAIAGFGTATYLFSAVFKKSFSHNYAAVLTALFGMNAAFWLFIPVQLVRALAGETRGWHEVSRLFTFEPFDLVTARSFVKIAFNQEFLLDKFMVATALSLGLCLMAVLWYAASRYLAENGKENLVLTALSAFGVMAMHAALGIVIFGGVAAACVFLLASGRVRERLYARRAGALSLAMLVCGLALLPYLLSLSRAKDEALLLPVGFSLPKMIGIFSSCALVIFLAAFQARDFLRSREIASRFVVLATAAVLAVSAALELPPPNEYDKLPFLLFFPLAVVGGWTLSDYANRGRTAARRHLRMIALCLLAFAPLNLFMFAAYYNTEPIHRVQGDERDVVSWVRDNTPRDAVFMDTGERVFLIAAGPRRYFLGSKAYAATWGYDRREIARRERVIDEVYSGGPLGETTLGALRELPYPVYVIVRDGDPHANAAAFEERASFDRVFSSGSVSVYEFDKSAVESAGSAPSAAPSEEETP